MKKLVADTGFWLALYDKHDEHHERSDQIFQKTVSHGLVCYPWPSLYEVFRTKFVKQRHLVERFARDFHTRDKHLIPDQDYRDEALRFISSGGHPFMHLSLVDAVIRAMLADPKYRFDGFVTFNARDFADVCAKRGIELLC